MSHKTDFLSFVHSFMDDAHCRIDDEGIASAAASIKAIKETENASFEPPAWMETPQQAIWMCLAINSINHRFWIKTGSGLERYEHLGLTGALAMRQGLELFLESRSWVGLTPAQPVSTEEVERFFGKIPDPEERAEALSEALGPKGMAAARMLADSIREEGVWDTRHARLAAGLLPFGFEDPLLKKAQLALWMAKNMLESQGMEAPGTLLTCFADYQIPKVLRGLGALVPSRMLAAKIDNLCPIEEGSPMEMALRAASIVACERIASSCGVEPERLDLLLWLRRNDFGGNFHLTDTRRY